MSDANSIELAVIGVMIKAPEMVDLISSRLKPSDFLSTANRSIYEHLLDLSDIGAPIEDMRFVSDSLRARSLVGENINSVRSDDLRIAVDQSRPASSDWYCDQLIYWSQLRGLRKLKLDLDGKLLSDNVSIRAVCDELFLGMEELLQRERMVTQTIGQASSELLRDAVKRSVTKDIENQKCSWGIFSVDHSITPMSGGDLVLVCARPSAGKTAAGMQSIMHNAANGKRVLFVSMEQSSAELAMRLLSGNKNISSRRIQAGDLSSDELEALYEEAQRHSACHVEIFDGGKIGVRQIRAIAKMMASRGGVDLVVIDYLQMLQPRDHRQQKHEQIEENAESLKALAREFGVPVIALAQLNRGAEGEIPTLAHIRGSGGAEQAADIVLLLHNPRADNDADRPAKWIFAKVRNGSPGSIELTWSPRRTKFLDPVNFDD